MLRASHSRPFTQIWMRNGNQVWMRALHEAEPRMDLIVVEVQALAIARFCLDPLAGTVAHDLKRPARLYSGQHADQPLLYVVARGDPAGDVLFVAGGRGQVLHRSPDLPG